MIGNQTRALPVVALLAAAACGQPTSDAFNFVLPLDSRLSSACANHSGLIGTEAVLRIGGHQDCPLDVDSSTLVASGSCPSITIGITRPLMLVYYLPHATLGQLGLAYSIGYVDLRTEALPESGDEVVVNLGEEGDTSIAFAPEQVAALESPDTSVSEDLRFAMTWSFEQTKGSTMNVDQDSDACPNLVEACEMALETTNPAPSPCTY